ncbi:MAG: type 1 glutamine amidotransferase [Actinomycetota bacterium]
MAEVSIVSVFPNLMGTYGDAGNELVLSHRLRLRGIASECLRVNPGTALPTGADIYLIGGGEDRAQLLAARLMADAMRSVVARGATVFAVCAGYQVLGESFTDSQGATHAGLGLLDVVTRPLAKRVVGEMIVSPALPMDALVGFENHQGCTSLGPGATPLGRVVTGTGNGDGTRTEGAMQGSIIATYLHGPALALNPALADLLLARVIGSLDPIDDELTTRARASRLNPV